MNHSIELDVYVIYSPEAENFDEVPLEVTFDLCNDDSYEITGYYLNGMPQKISYEKVREFNKNLDERIRDEIHYYIMNYEPDYMDCE